MKTYASEPRYKGVKLYDYDKYHTWVDVQFYDSGVIYRYPKTKYGQQAIDEIIALADRGVGLNAYINKLPQHKRRKMGLEAPIYCGVRGGYSDKDGWWRFPIGTRGQARAALSYAHWAPDPDGIRRCVCEYYPSFPSCSKLKP